MKTIMEMAREADPKANLSETYCLDPETRAWLETFAEMVREEATAEANARANASWALMCEKMVSIEREACAKVCEKHGYDHYCGNVTDKIAETIRARGQA